MPHIPLLSRCLAISALALAPAGAVADERASSDATGPVSSDKTCLEIGTDQGWIGRLDCLNAALRALAVARQAKTAQLYRGSSALAGAPPAEIGLFDQSGVSERLGSSFGRSAQPQRPPPPTWSLPFGAGK
jgi:hypothetical protein